MEWLWIILRYLFPLDPVRQCIAALCDRVGAMVKIVLDDDALDELAADPDARIALEAALIDYEATLRLTISARAHQIARLRFIPGQKAFHRPTTARSLIDLVKRIRILALDCADIERLAYLQAERLKRARNADPLSALAAHGSTDAALRAAAHHEPAGVAEVLKNPIALILSSTRSVRPSKDERVLTAARTTAAARAPPVFDVFANRTTRLAGFTCEVATSYAAPCSNAQHQLTCLHERTGSRTRRPGGHHRHPLAGCPRRPQTAHGEVRALSRLAAADPLAAKACA